MNDNPVDCQSRGVTEPQREVPRSASNERLSEVDAGHRKRKRAKSTAYHTLRWEYNLIFSLHYRGVAQMVACLFRVQEAMGSNPVTPTKKKAY